jgi:ABC-type maltose transport system permease subunit
LKNAIGNVFSIFFPVVASIQISPRNFQLAKLENLLCTQTQFDNNYNFIAANSQFFKTINWFGF